MELPDRGQAKSWEGCEVLDVDGEVLGTCVGVFADTDTGITEWLQVDVTGLGRSFVPALDAADAADGKVRVRFTAVAVRGAPRVEGQEELSQSQERSLYDHYGVPVSTEETDTVLPAYVEVADPDPEPAPAAPASSTTPAPPDRPPLVPITPAAPTATSSSTSTGTSAASMPPDVEPEPAVEQVLSTDREPVLTARPEPEFAMEVPGPSTSAAVAPLAGVAALGAAIWLVLRALQARSRRKQPAARATRFASGLPSSASGLAGRSARQLSQTVASSAKAAATASEDASKAAAKRKQATTKAAAKRKDETTKAAGKRKQATTKAAAKRKQATTKAVAKRKDETAKAAAKGRKKTVSTVSGAKDAASRRGQAVASGTTAAPRKAARKVRRTKRAVARNLWQALLVAVGGTGYVLGAKAGEERYEQIEQQASQLASRPEVQQVLEKVRGQVS